jgi:hypothetical protein
VEVLGIKRNECQRYCRVTSYTEIINTPYTNTLSEISYKLHSELINKNIVRLIFFVVLKTQNSFVFVHRNMFEITHPVGNYKIQNRGFCAAIICHNFTYSVEEK